jgi:uncharacterized membrane protein (GlpM family)
MARKLFIAYFVYVAVVFLFNSYLMKENYADAIIKAVISGVIFAGIYAIVIIRAEKREKEKK